MAVTPMTAVHIGEIVFWVLTALFFVYMAYKRKAFSKAIIKDTKYTWNPVLGICTQIFILAIVRIIYDAFYFTVIENPSPWRQLVVYFLSLLGLVSLILAVVYALVYVDKEFGQVYHTRILNLGAGIISVLILLVVLFVLFVAFCTALYHRGAYNDTVKALLITFVAFMVVFTLLAWLQWLIVARDSHDKKNMKQSLGGLDVVAVLVLVAALTIRLVYSGAAYFPTVDKTYIRNPPFDEIYGKWDLYVGFYLSMEVTVVVVLGFLVGWIIERPKGAGGMSAMRGGGMNDPLLAGEGGGLPPMGGDPMMDGMGGMPGDPMMDPMGGMPGGEPMPGDMPPGMAGDGLGDPGLGPP